MTGPAKRNTRQYPGDGYVHQVTVTDGTDPVDLTAWTWTAPVTGRGATINMGVDSTDAATGTLVLTIAESAALDVGDYRWALHGNGPGTTDRVTLLTGNHKVTTDGTPVGGGHGESSAVTWTEDTTAVTVTNLSLGGTFDPSDLEAADTALGDRIGDEETARTAADATLTAAVADVASDLADETTARTNADTALDGRLDTVEATLPTKADLVAGTVPSAQLPSYVDDVVEAADFASLPATGETGKVYVTVDTNITYRWSGSAYVAIGSDLALGETSSTAYRGDRGATAYTHSQTTSGNPHQVTASDVDADPTGTAAAAITTHEGDSDPHGDRAYTDTRTDGYTVYRASRLVDPSTDLSGGDFTDLTIPGVGTFPRAFGAGFVLLAASGTDAGVWTITETGPCIPADPQPRVGQLVIVIADGQAYQGAGDEDPTAQATSYNTYPNLSGAGPATIGTTAAGSSTLVSRADHSHGFPAWVDWTPTLICGLTGAEVDLGTGGDASARVLKVGTTCWIDGRIIIGSSPDFNGGGQLFLPLPYDISSASMGTHDLRSIGGRIDLLDGSPSSADGIYTPLMCRGGPGLQAALGSVEPVPANWVTIDFDLRPGDVPTPTSFASNAPIDLTAGGVELVLVLGPYETT
ncbi:hypothetical protein PO878_03885 [Iamia majanohamensis]|uniref:Minor tail protein n=1 Tax=Iamia majanohamensis TaxID=467976 RepID=A0AAE9YB40_9ACTN|nr:hypothetical protein [Iamia majanohamensis]WCO67863.1 hypothetical protein PO878_03885 [Iamia majanohamensis]